MQHTTMMVKEKKKRRSFLRFFFFFLFSLAVLGTHRKTEPTTLGRQFLNNVGWRARTVVQCL